MPGGPFFNCYPGPFSNVRCRMVIDFKFADNLQTKNKIQIPQLLIINELRDLRVPRTGLEPARLSALAPETSASTIPPPGQVPLFVSAKLEFLFGFAKFFTV